MVRPSALGKVTRSGTTSAWAQKVEIMISMTVSNPIRPFIASSIDLPESVHGSGASAYHVHDEWGVQAHRCKSTEPAEFASPSKVGSRSAWERRSVRCPFEGPNLEVALSRFVAAHRMQVQSSRHSQHRTKLASTLVIVLGTLLAHCGRSAPTSSDGITPSSVHPR